MYALEGLDRSQGFIVIGEDELPDVESVSNYIESPWAAGERKRPEATEEASHGWTLIGCERRAAAENHSPDRSRIFAPASELIPVLSAAERRLSDNTRLQIPLDVIVEMCMSDGQFISERTVTENISRDGAAVFSGREVERGRYVRLISEHLRVAVMAAVRNVRKGDDGMIRLHLQYINQKWPIESLGM